jgi:hypothetical protein
VIGNIGIDLPRLENVLNPLGISPYSAESIDKNNR